MIVFRRLCMICFFDKCAALIVGGHARKLSVRHICDHEEIC